MKAAETVQEWETGTRSTNSKREAEQGSKNGNREEAAGIGNERLQRKVRTRGGGEKWNREAERFGLFMHAPDRRIEDNLCSIVFVHQSSYYNESLHSCSIHVREGKFIKTGTFNFIDEI